MSEYAPVFPIFLFSYFPFISQLCLVVTFGAHRQFIAFLRLISHSDAISETYAYKPKIADSTEFRLSERM